MVKRDIVNRRDRYLLKKVLNFKNIKKTKNENNKKYVNLREISEIPKKAVDTSKGTPIKGGCGNVFPPI